MKSGAVQSVDFIRKIQMRVCRVTRIQAHVPVVLLVVVPIILLPQFLDFDSTALDEFGQVRLCARIGQPPGPGSDMGRDAPAGGSLRSVDCASETQKFGGNKDTTKLHEACVERRRRSSQKILSFFRGWILFQINLMALTEAGAVFRTKSPHFVLHNSVRTASADPAFDVFGSSPSWNKEEEGPSPPRRHGLSGGMST